MTTYPDEVILVDLVASISLPIGYYGVTAFIFAPKILKWYSKSPEAKPPAVELAASGYAIRDWRLSTFEKKQVLRYFPFIEGKNVFP